MVIKTRDDYLEYLRNIKVGDDLKVKQDGKIFDCVATKVTDLYILVDCEDNVFEHFLVRDGYWERFAQIVI